MNPILLTVLDLLAKSAVLLLLAWTLQSFWQGAAAAQRCLVWLAAFAVLLLLPLTFFLRPVWTLKVAEAKPAPSVRHDMPVIESLPMTAADLSVMSAPVVHAAPAWHMPQLRAGLWAGIAWLTGAVLLLARRALGTLQLRRLFWRSRACKEARVIALTSKLAAELGVRRAVQVRISDHVSVPLTWGFLKPVLMLPAETLEWNEAPLEAALLHELGHIRHWDALTRLLMTLACALQWPNVLLWMAARSWRTAQEQACDDLVLTSGASREDYAMQLLRAARSVQVSGLLRAPVLPMALPSTLETRLGAIMDEKRDRRPLRRGAVLAGLAASFAMLLLCGAWQVRAADKPEAEAASTHAEGVTKTADIVAGDAYFKAYQLYQEAERRAQSGDLSGARQHYQQAEQAIRAVAQAHPEFQPQMLAFRLSKIAEALQAIKGGDKQPEVGQQGKPMDLMETLDDSHAIRVGDEVLLRIVEEQGKTLEMRVLDSGEIEMPRLGLVKAAGLTTKKLAYFIKGELMKRGHKEAIINVAVVWHGEKPPVLPGYMEPSAFSILGQVHREGKYKLAPGQKLTLDQVVQFAGGTTDFADASKISVFRKTPQGMKKIIVNHDDPTKNNNLAKDLIVHAGDVIIVNARLYAAAGGRSAAASSAAASGPTLGQAAPQPVLQSEASPRSVASTDYITQKLQHIIFPSVKFQDATVEEALEFIRVRSRELDPSMGDVTDKGVNIILKAGVQPYTARLNLDLRDVPLAEVLNYVTELANLKYRVTPYAVIVMSAADAAADAAAAKVSAPPVTHGIVPQNSTAPTPEKSAVQVRAEQIILPQVQFSGASLAEAVEFLRVKAKLLDPAHEGVNILLHPTARAQKAQLSLDLKNVPLSEALRYVAELAGLALRVEGNTFIMEEKGKEKSAPAPAPEGRVGEDKAPRRGSWGVVK